jgi:alcohol dehydrogenase class IV
LSALRKGNITVDIYQIMLPMKVCFGVGSLDIIGDEASKLGANQALIVTDPGVYQTGLVDPVKQRLSRAKLSVDIFSEAEPEPTLPGLNAAAEKLGREGYDLLVGVGGGSSMDTAKGLSVLLAHGGRGQDYVGINKVPGPGIPIFTLPTTAGTGSEVTKAAVFDDPEKRSKFGIQSPYILARLAIVDPTLTYGCPQKVTATAGIDALTHAIESYTSINASTFTDALEVEAMRLIAGSLRAVVKDGSDKEARNHMAEGALFGGFGIAHAGGAAAHALAYPLGSRFHLPHGVTVGLLLPYVMECNLSTNPAKYATIAHRLGVKTEGLSLQEAAEKGVEAFKNLAKDVGITLHLRDLGIAEEALEELAVASMDVTRLLNNNPRKLSLDDVRRIWQNAW